MDITVVMSEASSDLNVTLDTTACDIDVDVGLTYASIQASKSYSVTANGDYSITPDEGYDGMAAVALSVNVPTPTGNIELTQQSGTDVTDYATASVRSGSVTLNVPTVNTSGLVTASASIGTAGWVASAPASVTAQLATQSAQTITPGTANQTIASGKYITGVQTILGDANLIAANIKKGVTIFGVTGTYEGGEYDIASTTLSDGSQRLDITDAE